MNHFYTKTKEEAALRSSGQPHVFLKEGEGMVFHIPGYENEKIYIKVNNKEGGC